MYKEIIKAGTWVYDGAMARVGMGDNVETNDVFSIMMNSKDEKRDLKYSLKDLWTESMLLLAAGMNHVSPPETNLETNRAVATIRYRHNIRHDERPILLSCS